MIDLSHALKHFFFAAILGALLMGFNPLASSAVLVNQSYLANDDGFLSSVGGSSENAESFTLLDAANLTSIVWWGSSAGTNDFLVQIGVSLGNWTSLAGTIVETPTADFDNENRAISRFEQTLNATLSLPAGAHFLSVSQEVEEWYWTVGSIDNDFGQVGNFFGDGQDWFLDDTAELSFQLIGERQSQAASEPGMIALLLMGIFALQMGRRRLG